MPLTCIVKWRHWYSTVSSVQHDTWQLSNAVIQASNAAKSLFVCEAIIYSKTGHSKYLLGCCCSPSGACCVSSGTQKFLNVRSQLHCHWWGSISAVKQQAQPTFDAYPKYIHDTKHCHDHKQPSATATFIRYQRVMNDTIVCLGQNMSYRCCHGCARCQYKLLYHT